VSAQIETDLPGNKREHSDGKAEMTRSKEKVAEVLKKETTMEWKSGS
jgi:hypothetical protein